jgi:hypothetical protein
MSGVKRTRTDEISSSSSQSQTTTTASTTIEPKIEPTPAVVNSNVEEEYNW